MTDVIIDDLRSLLTHFSKNTYSVQDADDTSEAIMQRCLLLADLDYTHSVIYNNGGELCSRYPSHLIVLENEKHRNVNNTLDTPPSLPRTAETIYESMSDSAKLKDLIRGARIARCHLRFPLPVILYKGRHVCRSATLAGAPEIYGRSGLDYLFANNDESVSIEEVDGAQGGELAPSDWPLCDKVRHMDIRLLKTLNVGTIIDLMVENKKVKFGMNVTSSEKVDKEKRYSDFTIISLPYPGCEFFKEFRENDYMAKGLVFDWAQTHVDAEIRIPNDIISTQLRITWDQYQIWDLLNLTQNYLKLILRYLTESSNGLLVHCISGWDRTPLFISLLRISLWADGVIHTSLNAHQLLYYTIAYDWMLFGHDLQDRLYKGEEIFFFCFYFLKYIQDEEFSIHTRHPKPKHAVFRNDSDVQLDNVMFENETLPTVSSVSSNLSLNSWGSNISQNSRDSQDNNPPAVFHVAEINQEDSLSNGNVVPWVQTYTSPNKDSTVKEPRSPLLPNRTSPVAVPMPGRFRQRNESTSSTAGSWQLISGTGSLRGSTTASSAVVDTTAKYQCRTCSGMPGLQETGTTAVDGEGCTAQCRRNKLDTLRSIFYNAYCQTVGFRMKDNSESAGIGQLLGNFVEKVNFLST